MPLVEQLREGVKDGRAAQLEVAGKLGHVAEQLVQITEKFSFLEKTRRIGGPSRPLRASRVSQQGKSPVFSAGNEVVDVFAQPPQWPPPSPSSGWSKLPATTSGPGSFPFGQPATGAGKVTTLPFEQLVPGPQLDLKSETEEEDEQDEEGSRRSKMRKSAEVESHCHFSPLGSDGEGEDDEEPEDVFQVTTQLDSGGTTPRKIQPVWNVRACSKSPPVKFRSTRQRSPGDTPGREAVVRQAAAMDGMDDEVFGWTAQWQLAAVEPRKELFF